MVIAYQKMHGMTKFQYYIERCGCAMNFYGGTGESAHKIFVKTPGQKHRDALANLPVKQQTSSTTYYWLITH